LAKLRRESGKSLPAFPATGEPGEWKDPPGNSNLVTRLRDLPGRFADGPNLDMGFLLQEKIARQTQRLAFRSTKLKLRYNENYAATLQSRPR
jgi:hypothetical protein